MLLISCNEIHKKYQSDEVLIGFSYIFPDTGFILLYGESGCGKTTLLNIISGVTDFNKGEVVFNNKTYHNNVNLDEVGRYIGYITQDPHFINYLTVLDNLKLCSTDDKKIESLLLNFGLEDKKNSYPGTLSGGEKQRVAIMQALLQDKEVLLLDEPTASLDRDNKINIFEVINGLKKSKLIICSSHDEEAKEYADEIIDFNNLKNTQTLIRKSSSKDMEKAKKIIQEKRRINSFMSKMNSYPEREKKSKILLTIVFIFSILALCICDTPENKAESNIKYTYQLNQILVYSDDINEPFLNDVKKNENIIEINLIYNKSVPDGIENEQDIYFFTDYNMTAKTIPFKKDAFYLFNCIEYGSYYTKAEQIILSHAMAESMGNPEDLIGEIMKVKMYDKSYNMEIVGVFREFNEIERQYLLASGISWTEGSEHDVFFINGEFTKRYIYEMDFLRHLGEGRTYALYFDTFKNMKSFYEYHKENESDIIFGYGDISVKILFLFEDMFIILMPIILTVIPISILLYYQIRKTEIIYNKHIFSIYQYLGYTVKEIKKSWIIISLIEILKLISFSLSAAVSLMLIVNFINSKTVIIPFQIFTFNIYLILLLVLLVSVLSVLVSLNTIKKVSIDGWYKVLLEQRDLI